MTDELQKLCGLVKGLNFAEYLKADGLSQSSLKILAKAPGLLNYYKENPEPQTAAQAVGQAVHTAILEPDSFDKSYVIKPDGMKFSTNEGKQWRDKQKLPIISGDDASLIRGMSESFKKHQAATLFQSQLDSVETSAFVTYRGVNLKGRFDGLSEDKHFILDLKTTQHGVCPGEFSKTIFNFGYHLQGAFYLLLAELLGINIKHFIIVAIEKNPPYPVAVYRLQNDAIAHGRKQLEKLIDIFIECKSQNYWPMYDGITEITLPAWVKTEISN